MKSVSENPFTLKKKKDCVVKSVFIPLSWIAWILIAIFAVSAVAYIGSMLVVGKLIVVRAVAPAPDTAPQGLVKGRFQESYDHDGNQWSVHTSPEGSYAPVLAGNNEYVWVNLKISGHCEASCQKDESDKRMDDVYVQLDQALSNEIFRTSRTDFLVDNVGATKNVALAVGRKINWPLVKEGIFIDKLEVKISP